MLESGTRVYAIRNCLPIAGLVYGLPQHFRLCATRTAEGESLQRQPASTLCCTNTHARRQAVLYSGVCCASIMYTSTSACALLVSGVSCVACRSLSNVAFLGEAIDVNEWWFGFVWRTPNDDGGGYVVDWAALSTA